MNPILQSLQTGFLFFDGAMGTQIHNANLPHAQHPESYNLTHPEAIRDIHARYLAAGANIISACTFGAYSHKMENAEAVIAAAIENARAAIVESGRTDCYIALDMGPTGKLLEPVGDAPFEEVYQIFKEAAVLGEKYGADCVIIETMIDLYETKAALLAVKENTALPVFCSVAYEAGGRTLTGGTPLSAVTMLEALGADAIGLNCGAGPDFASSLAAELLQYASVPVIVQPNAGLPCITEGCEHATFNLTAEDFAKGMADIAKNGARLLGGCCGTTPAHIHTLVLACKDIAPAPITDKTDIYLCTNGTCLRLGDAPEIGTISADDPAVLEALQAQDMFEIADIAIEHRADDAELLIVRLGANGVDEAAIMKDVINAIQQVAPIPMQIETANADALAIALRILNGKAAVKLLSDDDAFVDEATALVVKYGGVLVSDIQI